MPRRAGYSAFKGPRLVPPAVAVRPSGLHGLIMAAVKPNTTRDYLRAIFAWDFWYRLFGDFTEPYSQSLADYVFWCFDSGEVSKSQVINLLCGIAALRPSWKLTILPLSWKAVKGWSKQVPTTSYLPVPRPVLLACAAALVKRGYWMVGLALIVGFDGYLRHGELRTLRVRDVSFVGNFAVLLLLDPKSGREQPVTTSSPFVIRCLRRLVRDRPDSDFLFGKHRRDLLPLFRQSQLWVGYSCPIFVIHSLRHGGATHDYVYSLRDLNGIMVHGRWAGLPVTRTYIHESQVLILQARAPVPATDPGAMVFLLSWLLS